MHQQVHLFRESKYRTACSLGNVLIPILFIFSLLLSACTTGGSTSSGSSSSDSPVTLKIIEWNNPATVALMQQMNAAFHKQYPNITIHFDGTTPTANNQYQQLQNTSLTANNVDIMAVQAFANAPQSWSTSATKPTWQQWIDSGNLLDLTGQSFLKYYDPAAIQQASTYNGKVYSVTTGRYADNGVFYNKAIFAQYNLKVPTTFSELMNDCKILQSQGIDPFVMGAKDTWPLNLAEFGLLSSLLGNQADVVKGLWTGTVKFTDPAEVQVLTRFQQIMNYTVKNFMGIDYLTAPSYFASGKAAMIPDGTWDAPTFKTANPSLQFGYFPLPGSDTASDNTKLAGKYDLAWVVNAKRSAAQRDAAMKWLAFFSQPDNYTKYVNAVGILPSQPNIQLQDAFLKELAPQISGGNFELAWDQFIVSKQKAGQYASGAGGLQGFQAQFLAPAGPIATPEELAQKTQADWDAATS